MQKTKDLRYQTVSKPQRKDLPSREVCILKLDLAWVSSSACMAHFRAIEQTPHPTSDRRRGAYLLISQGVDTTPLRAKEEGTKPMQTG